MEKKMADFEKALQTGLAANADAAARKREIHEVVRTVSEQVRHATGGAIGVEIRETVREKIRYLTKALSTMTGVTKDVENVTYTVLSARREGEPGGIHDLCEFRLAATGYPVAIESDDVSDMALDREGLEHAIETVFTHPNTGKKIQALLDMETKQSAE
jgi:hypothetical protein